MLEAIVALVSALVMVIAFVLQPPIARCPPRWSLGEGIRRDGHFACWGPVEPADCGEPVGVWKPCSPRVRIPGRIYCTSGQTALVVDERTVACQRIR